MKLYTYIKQLNKFKTSCFLWLIWKILKTSCFLVKYLKKFENVLFFNETSENYGKRLCHHRDFSTFPCMILHMFHLIMATKRSNFRFLPIRHVIYILLLLSWMWMNLLQNLENVRVLLWNFSVVSTNEQSEEIKVFYISIASRVLIELN